MISTIFLVAWVNCTLNSLVIVNERANTKIPKTYPLTAFIEPTYHMKAKITTEHINPHDIREVAGADTVIELANRKPENLHLKLVETNNEKKLVLQLPGLKQVQSWVEAAKKLLEK